MRREERKLFPRPSSFMQRPETEPRELRRAIANPFGQGRKHRRSRLSLGLAGGAGLALTAALLSLVFGASGGAASAPAQPNIVVIVLDDLNVSMFRQALSLRRGSETEGVSFTRAFSTTPLCCPGRSTLLTGLYAHNHGVRSNSYWSRDLTRFLSGGERSFLEHGNESRTVASYLQAGGYTTSFIGKYLNGYGGNDGGPSGNDPNAPPDEPSEEGSYMTRVPFGWSDWHAFVGKRGVNDNGNWTCLTRDCSFQPTADGDHRTDQITRRAVRFVESQRDPFFLYLADEAPHSEVRPADRYAHAHDGARGYRSASYNEDDVSDKPGYIRRDRRLSPPGVRPPGCSADEWPIRLPTPDRDCWISADYSQHAWENGLEQLEGANDLYDSVVATLERTGKLQSTYIFLVSDNGLHVGEHRQSYGKNTPYIEDLRVPFVVRGPGTPRNARLPHLVGLQDLAPTVLDLAGQPTPAHIDGRSLRPLIAGPTPEDLRWRKRLGIEGWAASRANVPKSARGDTPTWRGVIDARRRYASYATGERELYRLALDPAELRNRAPHAPREEMSALKRVTEDLHRCRGSTCRTAEDR